jgi:hypothetical protein
MACTEMKSSIVDSYAKSAYPIDNCLRLQTIIRSSRPGSHFSPSIRKSARNASIEPPELLFDVRIQNTLTVNLQAQRVP